MPSEHLFADLQRARGSRLPQCGQTNHEIPKYPRLPQTRQDADAALMRAIQLGAVEPTPARQLNNFLPKPMRYVPEYANSSVCTVCENQQRWHAGVRRHTLSSTPGAAQLLADDAVARPARFEPL